MIQRRKRNSSKINLTISVVFHSILIFTVFYFAAREGMLGKKLKQLTVTMVPKEKKPEPPKEKPAEKVEQPKPVEAAKVAAPPKVETATAPPPAAETGPAVAPAPATLPAFEFDDGAKEVRTVSDHNGIYAALVEHALKSHWNRPEDLQDDSFVVEVELGVESNGSMKEAHWVRSSGNPRWDNSVKAALAATPVISRPPPKGFPDHFKVRFDVENLQSESALFGVR